MYDSDSSRFFERQGFFPITKESYPLFKKYESYSDLQEMSAAMLITWSTASRGLYKIIGGNLCGVYFYDKKPVSFTIHRGPEPGEYPLQRIIDTLYGFCREAELPPLHIKFIDEKYLPEFQSVEGYGITTGFNRNDGEYVYKKEDFVSLEGKINTTKRRQINKCLNSTDITFEPITGGNAGICLDIQEEWCRKKDCGKCASYCGCEKDALKIMLSIFDECVHKGALLCVDHIPRGYFISETVSEKMSHLYFGKGLNDNHYLYGLYMMTKSGAAACFNFNEDMGSEGLRQFKTHLGAYTLFHKYFCTFEKKEGIL